MILETLLRQVTFEDQQNLLFRLGYFFDLVEDWSSESLITVKRYADSPDSDAFKLAVKQYQHFHTDLPAYYQGGWRNNTIKQDGIFGPETMRILETRFCGCPDILPKSSASSGLRRWDLSKFTDGKLGVIQDMEFSGITRAELTAAWISALQEIRSHGRDIEYIGGGNIHAHSRRIDRAGGVLAWSYLPGYGSGPSVTLEQRYDNSERWAGRVDTFLRPVIIHELLHAFGLDHTNNAQSIMYPSMNGVQHMWNWEIDQIHKRYGRRVVPPDSTIEIKDGQFQVVIGGDKVIRCQVILDRNTPI